MKDLKKISRGLDGRSDVGAYINKKKNLSERHNSNQLRQHVADSTSNANQSISEEDYLRLKEAFETKLFELNQIKERYSQLNRRYQSLAENNRIKEKRTSILERQLESAKSRIQELEKIVEQNENAVKDLLGEVDELISRKDLAYPSSTWKYEDIEQLNRNKMLLESYNSSLKNTLAVKERELDDIKNSTIYKIVRRIANFIDKTAPPATLRRRAINTLKNTIESRRVIRELEVQAKSSTKLSSLADYEHIQVTGDLVPLAKTAVNELEKIEKLDLAIWSNEIISPKEAPPIEDKWLRQFMKFGSHKINQLEEYPLVSIIIATYNNVDYLKKNIESIEKKTTYPNYEIIIVTNNLDAGSPMRNYLSTIKHQVYIYENEYSFGGINNFGASKANGSLLLFINDDTEVVTPQWLEALVKLASYPSTGAVGGKLLYPDGSLQEAGAVVWGDGTAWNYGRYAFNADDPNVNFVREVDYCSGAFLMVKKSLFMELGGFDERYFPAYWEDADMCFAMREKGYNVLYQPLATIIHKEGGTQGTDTSKGIKAYQVTNQKKFFEKWGHKITGRLLASQENAIKERSRRNGLRILYIDHYVPTPDQDAGSLFAFNTLCILSWLGHNITFWPENLYKSEPYVTELQQKGIEVIYGPNNFEDFFKVRGKDYDYVIMARPHISIKFIDTILKIKPTIKIIYETHDIGYIRLYRQALIERKPERFVEARNMKQIELRLARASTYTFVRTRKEGAILKNEDSSINPVVLPLIYIPPDTINPYENRRDIIFVGGYMHPPNVDAAIFLANEIFPLVRNRITGVKLYLVGSNPPEAIRKLESDDIVVTGYVPDISQYLQGCRIMVAPLRYGSGIKGKIMDSMMNGLPVVTTSIGAEGMDLIDGISVLIAETPEQFASSITELYNNADLWNEISANSYALAIKKYAPENIRDFLKALIAADNSLRSLQYNYG